MYIYIYIHTNVIPMPCQCSPRCPPLLSRDLLTLESCEVRRHHLRHQLLSVDLGAWAAVVFHMGMDNFMRKPMMIVDYMKWIIMNIVDYS